MFDHSDDKSELKDRRLKASCHDEKTFDASPTQSASGNAYPQLSPSFRDNVFSKSYYLSTADLGYLYRLLALYGMFPLHQLQAFSFFVWTSRRIHRFPSRCAARVIPSQKASIAKPASSVSLPSYLRSATPRIHLLGLLDSPLLMNHSSLAIGIPIESSDQSAPLTALNCAYTRLDKLLVSGSQRAVAFSKSNKRSITVCWKCCQ